MISVDSHSGQPAHAHHPRQQQRAAVMALIPIRKKNSQPPPPLLLLLRIFFLSGIRAIFVNFVTFSTKHGSTSDKACARLMGSRYAQANAHRRPRSRCRVFAAQTSSLSDYILDSLIECTLTAINRPFSGLPEWAGSQYQKKHSPTHTHPDHQMSFINFLHLLRSIVSSLFNLYA